MKLTISHILFASALLLMQCTNIDTLTGAGSETTNSLTGTVVHPDGTPQPNAIVHLIPDSYDIVKDGALPARLSDTTNGNGTYNFSKIDTGTYTIQAYSISEGHRALVTAIPVFKDSVSVAPATVLKPGSIEVELPENINRSTGYIYIPGTTIFSFLNTDSSFAMLDSVPPGIIPSIVHSSTNSSVTTVIRYSIEVISDDMTAVQNSSWPYSKKLFLNTSATGADISESVYHFPVLIRLTSDNFNFNEAQSNGNDLLFTNRDNSSLPYQIERWDPVSNNAEIWVKVDSIAGNNDSQHINMYWGDPAISQPLSNGASVFDTANGFQGVWHLAETGNATAFDATHNKYNGTPNYMADSSQVPGAVGMGRDFDGKSSYISMLNTASSKLDFPENGTYSISLWVYADTIDSIWHGIVSKGYEQYYMQYKCFQFDSAAWEFVEYKDLAGWEYSTAPSNPENNAWVYLTGVRDGANQYLYINGTMVRDFALLNARTIARNTECDFTIGCHPMPSSVPVSFFDGKIDEVRVRSGVPGESWIKLCYMNQKAQDALIRFGN